MIIEEFLLIMIMNIESPFDYIHDDDDNENNYSGNDG